MFLLELKHIMIIIIIPLSWRLGEAGLVASTLLWVPLDHERLAQLPSTPLCRLPFVLHLLGDSSVPEVVVDLPKPGFLWRCLLDLPCCGTLSPQQAVRKPVLGHSTYVSKPS